MSIELNEGSGGKLLASDDVGAVSYQKSKIVYGSDGLAIDVTEANPLPVSLKSNGTVNTAFFRYLDTVGDGSGVKNTNLDHSSVQGIYRIAPPAASVFRVTRMIISLEDATGFSTAEYGNLGIALANGIGVRIHDGTSTVLDLMDGIPVKTNGAWGRLCYDVNLSTFGTGNEMLLVRWTFDKSGMPLRLDGDQTQELQVTIDDNLTGLISQYFQVQGYAENTSS